MKMNRLKLVAAAVVAAALSACSAAPTWNTGQFPHQPEYQASTAQAAAVQK
jgi:outer membrane biogenesis lipoprotein LolB